MGEKGRKKERKSNRTLKEEFVRKSGHLVLQLAYGLKVHYKIWLHKVFNRMLVKLLYCLNQREKNQFHFNLYTLTNNELFMPDKPNFLFVY